MKSLISPAFLSIVRVFRVFLLNEPKLMGLCAQGILVITKNLELLNFKN
jgi:hypothetical protein